MKKLLLPLLVILLLSCSEDKEREIEINDEWIGEVINPLEDFYNQKTY